MDKSRSNKLVKRESDKKQNRNQCYKIKLVFKINLIGPINPNNSNNKQ